VTCSLGVAKWEAGDTTDILIRRADVALYEAESTGRNKVVAADTFALSDQHAESQGATRVLRRPSLTRLPTDVTYFNYAISIKTL
jgi:predicted signal transduction protein with EAL and GGDEF domain